MSVVVVQTRSTNQFAVVNIFEKNDFTPQIELKPHHFAFLLRYLNHHPQHHDKDKHHHKGDTRF